MMRRHRLPMRRLPDDGIDKLMLNEIVARNTSGAWLGNALGEEAAHLRDIALSVANPAVYSVAKVFELHGLGEFDTADNDALYRVITDIAARLIRDRLTGSLGDGRRDPGAGEVAVSVVLRGLRGQ